MLDSILGSLTAGFRLSNLKFFQPKEVFFAEMEKQFSTRLLYEIGAGVGHVSAGLSARGFRVLALDLYERDDTEFPVLITNAVTHSYREGSALLICRPCHSGFVEATIRRALIQGVTSFVYVSMARNTSNDLGVFRKEFRTVRRFVGEERENMYVWNIATPNQSE